MAQSTIGTELFFYDPGEEKVYNLGCVQSISGIGAEVNKIDVSCMGKGEKQYIAGQLDPQDVTIEFKFDPNQTSAQEELYYIFQDTERDPEAKELIWSVGLPDGDQEPTFESGDLTMSEKRTQIRFYGFVQNYEIEFETDEAIEATLTIGATKAYKLGDPE